MSMYYIIKRELEPLDGSINEMFLNEEPYDIVKSIKNSGLENISDFIVEGDVVVKSDPRTDSAFRTMFEKKTGVQLKDLLLG